MYVYIAALILLFTCESWASEPSWRCHLQSQAFKASHVLLHFPPVPLYSYIYATQCFHYFISLRFNLRVFKIQGRESTQPKLPLSWVLCHQLLSKCMWLVTILKPIILYIYPFQCLLMMFSIPNGHLNPLCVLI